MSENIFTELYIVITMKSELTDIFINSSYILILF
jgi:hypothetical protein